MIETETVRRNLASSPIHLCPERALLLTEFFKHHANRDEPAVIQRAKALHYILSNKSIEIYPGELIVGNAGTKRRSCIMQPELSSVFMGYEILWIDRRGINPMQISWKDKLKLLTRVFPYWLRNCMPVRMMPSLKRTAAFVADQLSPKYYILNEAGGIGHFLPDYGKMLKLGTRGYLDTFSGRKSDLHKAGRIVCDALETWAAHIADQADDLARSTDDAVWSSELREIARICRKVPREPADTFHEAVQSLWLTHLGVELESLNSAISLGRIDQYLYPYYRQDLDEGRITRERALDLLLQFSAKTCEHVFLLSSTISQYHGGYLVAQAAIVGGTDPAGEDSVNPFTYVMLDVMERHRMREPNFQARVHRNSPPEYVERALDVARQGHGAPALFNDEAVVPALVRHGIPVEDARDYGIVGCVELSIPGKSFFSTDAGLFNLPMCMELALNSGRRWSKRKRVGAATPDPATFKDIDDVIEAFKVQLNTFVDRMIDDFHIAEKGNRDYNPTPLSSMLVEGCMESGHDLTEGGAVYNWSGIQGVGVADVADCLAALDTVVFREKRRSMRDVVDAMRADFKGHESLRSELSRAPKFGNDAGLADGYADLVVTMFHDSLGRYTSTRGGTYVPGFYSVTCNVAFGRRTGPLPSGRKAGEPFASSIGPAAGADRCGPTALLNSVASIDSSLMANGNALNMRFDPGNVEGEKGLGALIGLTKGFFEKGGMELQLNVLDPEMLEDARANPGKYPELVVRVAGYCAYFDDLPEGAKDEIISRTRLTV